MSGRRDRRSSGLNVVLNASSAQPLALSIHVQRIPESRSGARRKSLAQYTGPRPLVFLLPKIPVEPRCLQVIEDMSEFLSDFVETFFSGLLILRTNQSR
jgi:hypothetical protein